MKNDVHYIAIDTNAWIYLANGTEPAKILRFITEEVYRGTIKLLVPELVISEWHRNKEKAVRSGALIHFNETSKALDRLEKLLGDEGETSMQFLFDEERSKSGIREYFSKFTGKRDSIVSAIQHNINVIDALFKNPNVEILPGSDDILLKAASYALEKKAPFLKKNSFADAVIYFSFIKYVTEHNIKGGYFVSYNTEDFCIRENNIKFLHPDLKGDLDATKSQFFTIVSHAIHTIEDTIVTREQLEVMEQIQQDSIRDLDREVCLVCRENMDEYYFMDMSLDGMDILDLRKGISPRKRLTKLTTGCCSWCSTLHFKCARCQTLTSVEDTEVNGITECENCGLSYYISSDDIEEFGEIEIKVVDITESCQKCGASLYSNGSGTNICERCEIEYSKEN